MSILQRHVLMAVAGAFFLITTPAHAVLEPAVTVTAGDASGAPGGQAAPTLTFGFASNYDFMTLTLNVDYNPAFMTFNAGASTITVPGAGTYGIQAFLDLLESTSADVAPGVKDFSSTLNDPPGAVSLAAGYAVGFAPVPAGSMVIAGVFDLKPGFSGAQVEFSGAISNSVGDEELFGNYQNLGGAPIFATITAVPEPRTWLMLLAGMGLAGTVAMRRRQFAQA